VESFALQATCSSETSVSFQMNTRRYLPEDRSTLKINLTDGTELSAVPFLDHSRLVFVRCWLRISAVAPTILIEDFCVPSQFLQELSCYNPDYVMTTTYKIPFNILLVTSLTI
jgi:hypothetical protein